MAGALFFCIQLSTRPVAMTAATRVISTPNSIIAHHFGTKLPKIINLYAYSAGTLDLADVFLVQLVGGRKSTLGNA